MPRKQVPIITGDPYHITARCHNGQWFDLPLPAVWSIMEDYLYLVSSMYEIRIHSFVLMSNHFHLMVSPTDQNLSSALLYFMRETSREITRLSGRVNQTYGTRNHKCHIHSHHYFMNAYKYLYRNPVRAGVCKMVEEYPYSTLSGLLGLRKLMIPVIEDTILLNPGLDQSCLDWLNRSTDPEHDEEMRLALRRPRFKIISQNRFLKKSPLESILL